MTINNEIINGIEDKVIKLIGQHILLLYIIGFIVISIFSYFILIHFPNSADEYAYLFQSETFSSGHLWNKTHPLQEFFNCSHILANDGKWVSRFPPGYPILLTISDLISIPSWLLNPILSSFTSWIFYIFTKKIHGTKIATISTLSLICSSFFIINGASYFSHMAALLFILLFYYFSILFMDTIRWRYAILAGMWIGFAFIVRPYSALLTAFPLLIFFASKQLKRTSIGAIFVFLGSLPFLIFLLYYNDAITGNPFMMVTQWLDPEEGIGFVKGHNWIRAIIYTKHHIFDLMLWTSPFIFLLLGNIFYLKREKREKSSWIELELWIFFTVTIGYSLYYNYGGNQYGPRFYFEGFPFMIIAATSMVFDSNENNSIRIYISKFLYILGFIIALILIPYHAMNEHNVIKERINLYTMVKNKNINNAIILVAQNTGVIRTMPTRDLIRNGLTIDDKNVIYARIIDSETYRKLHKYFYNRKIYRYERENNSVNGRLIEINDKNN